MRILDHMFSMLSYCKFFNLLGGYKYKIYNRTCFNGISFISVLLVPRHRCLWTKLFMSLPLYKIYFFINWSYFPLHYINPQRILISIKQTKRLICNDATAIEITIPMVVKNLFQFYRGEYDQFINKIMIVKGAGVQELKESSPQAHVFQDFFISLQRQPPVKPLPYRPVGHIVRVCIKIYSVLHVNLSYTKLGSRANYIPHNVKLCTVGKFLCCKICFTAARKS